MNKKTFYTILGLIMAVVVGLGVLVVSNWTKEIPYETAAAAELTATVADAGGTDTSSAFRFVFPEEISSASVRKYL
ncbi:MAG: hypothetical protein IIZ45_01740, partial [Firmicutes bacterium]|nr:hypothetical protein [Bacillota bacterium]